MIQVLLATYNGGRHLPALLASLDGQTEQDFTVLARDDGSTDQTVEVLREWGERHPGRLELIEDGAVSGSAAANFSRLLTASSAPYVMCCDQDDVWLSEKIAHTLATMRQLEGDEPPPAVAPCLVHTDLEVVDDALATLAPSFWRYQKLVPATARRLNRILVQNVVTGCTMMVNRALLDRALPLPPAAIMHDWWLSLVACAFGRTGEVSRATIRYRQHAANQVGAKAWTAGYVARKAIGLWDRGELAESMRRIEDQADAFGRRYSDALAPAQRACVTALAGLGSAGFLARRLRILRHRLFKIGLIRNLGMLLRV